MRCTRSSNRCVCPTRRSGSAPRSTSRADSGARIRSPTCDLTAFLTPKGAPAPIRMGVSTWRRAADTMLPARIKTSTNYQAARLARIEGRSRGYADMIMLNNQERVAESGGACVLLVRDGKVFTPPSSEGALESIMVDIIEELAKEQRIPFERRPIDRTELYIADEIALAGTLAEVLPVLSVDGNECTRKTRLLATLGERYFAAARGIQPHPALDLRCGAMHRPPTPSERRRRRRKGQTGELEAPSAAPRSAQTPADSV